MADLRVRVLGPTEVTLEGRRQRLTPLTRRLLVRLVAADGAPVTTSELYRDIWLPPASERVHNRAHMRERNEVQKRVLELRRALSSDTVSTSSVLTGPRVESTYRLHLAPESLDSAHFEQLTQRAQSAAPVTAVGMLQNALALWQGPALVDAAKDGFAAPLIRRLTELRTAAQNELIRLHTLLGHPELALPLGQSLHDADPDDPAARHTLESLRAQLRDAHRSELFRCASPALRTRIEIVRGALPDQLDADLAVGVTDTFASLTEPELIGTSLLQGQTVLSDADAVQERALERLGLQKGGTAKRQVAHTVHHGPRYPPGTVVPLASGERRLYAAVCSRSKDLTIEMSQQDLREGLAGLWKAVAARTLGRPIALPVLGARLSAVSLTRAQIIAVIAESFLEHAEAHGPAAPALRIVVPVYDLAATDLSEAAQIIDAAMARTACGCR